MEYSDIMNHDKSNAVMIHLLLMRKKINSLEEKFPIK